MNRFCNVLVGLWLLLLTAGLLVVYNDSAKVAMKHLAASEKTAEERLALVKMIWSLQSDNERLEDDLKLLKSQQASYDRRIVRIYKEQDWMFRILTTLIAGQWPGKIIAGGWAVGMWWEHLWYGEKNE